jgi:hypothetical protein
VCIAGWRIQGYSTSRFEVPMALKLINGARVS